VGAKARGVNFCTRDACALGLQEYCFPSTLGWLSKQERRIVAIRSLRNRHYSNCLAQCGTQSISFVGAESGDEFSHAMGLTCQEHDVIKINPRETASAKAFRRGGRRFIRARIEDLPPGSCRFDFICENYPYPSGRHYVPPRPFALARLSLLKPGGQRILVTESPRYASLLKGVGDYNDAVRARFRSTLSLRSIDEAPPSAYPRADTRYRLIFQRCW